MKIPTLVLSFVICALLAVRPITVYAGPFLPGACAQIPGTQTCLDATPCKTLGSGDTACLAGAPLPQGAVSLPAACWQYSYHFACARPTPVDTCTPYATNPACSLTNSICSNRSLGSNVCNEFSQTYSCITTPAQTQQVLQCANGLFNALPRTPPVNTSDSFVRAAIAAEMVREASTYQDPNHKVFGGIAETCTKGYYGLKDCCKSAPGAKSNGALMTMAATGFWSAARYAGASAVDLASPYVFDAMYNYAPWMEGMVEAAAAATNTASNVTINNSLQATGTNFANNGPTLSLYGFTYGSSAGLGVGSGFLGANQTLMTFGSGTSATSIVVNPYVLAAYVVLNYVQDLLACTEGEKRLAMHKGAHLSAQVASNCISYDIVGTCLQDEETYCSFNSTLAKIINMQGKPQLGLPVNDCAGVAITDLKNMNFSTMDWSEFTGVVLDTATKNIPTNMKGNYTPIMQSTTQGSSQQMSPALPSYP